MTTTTHTPAASCPTPSPAQPPQATAASSKSPATPVGGLSRTAQGVEHLRAYIAREGHATVPQKYVADDGFTLGSWVNTTRREHTAGRLPAARIAELDTLGMVWDSYEAGYRAGVDHLRAYIARVGHATVPQKFVADDGFTLGAWANDRRRDHTVGRLSPTRFAELDALGMVWDLREASYRTGADHLRAYAAEQGHGGVPSSHVADDGFKLGIWANNRRHDRTVGRLSAARIAELDALGMVWDLREAHYQAGLDHLRAYLAQQGHVIVPQKYVADDGFTLGAWVSSRRQDHTIGRLSTARITELDALGMAWD